MPNILETTDQPNFVNRIYANVNNPQPFVGFKTHEEIARNLFAQFERRNADLPGVARRLHQWFERSPTTYSFATGAIRRQPAEDGQYSSKDTILIACERVSGVNRVTRRETTEAVTMEFTIAELFPEVNVSLDNPKDS